MLLVLAGMLVVANAGLALVVVNGLRGIYVQVQQTQDVLTALYRLDGDIRRVSRFHREFLQSGLTPFLADYRAARQRVPAEIAQIRMLTADSPDQQRRLDVVQRRLVEDASAVDAAIALGRPGPETTFCEACSARSGSMHPCKTSLPTCTVTKAGCSRHASRPWCNAPGRH